MTIHHYDLTTLYDALRTNLITWEGVQRSQESRYQRCANGCDAPGKWRTLDGHALCGSCYLAVAADERAEIQAGER